MHIFTCMQLMSGSPQRPEEGVGPLELEFVVSYSVWVLGTEFWFSTGVVRALNLGVLSPTAITHPLLILAFSLAHVDKIFALGMLQKVNWCL